jgi:hypothetical protein
MVKQGTWGNCLVRQDSSEDNLVRAALAPSLRSQPESKKLRREQENVDCVGGLRNPTSAVARNSGLQRLGAELREFFGKLFAEHPRLLTVAELAGIKDFQGPPREDVILVQKSLCQAMGVAPAVNPAPPGGRPSPIQADLCDALAKRAGDPECHIGTWAREGAPLGMDVPIPTCGIFPFSDNQILDSEKFLAAVLGPHACNYESFESQKDLAEEELQRVLGHQYIVQITPEEMGILPMCQSKLALIVKTRDDGTLKLRLIIDLRRSGANSQATVPERPVLPRLQYAQTMMANLAEEFPAPLQGDLELVVAGWSDAYHHFNVHASEWKYLWGTAWGKYILFITMCFGLTGAPLVWCRFAALMARLGQAILPPREGRLQLYIDDPILALRGNLDRRNQLLAMVLWLWTATGGSIAWHKVTRGWSAVWIGATLTWSPTTIQISIPEKAIVEVVARIDSILSGSVVPFETFRKLTGWVSWLAQVLPHSRWLSSRLWAILTDKLTENDSPTPKCVKQVEPYAISCW